MGRPLLVAFLVVSVAFGSIVTATEGRAAPQCAEFDLSAVSSSTTGVAVEPNACLIVNLGTRSSESTLSVNIDVLDDSMDVLLFDQNGISVYKNGQNYRSSFVPEGSLNHLSEVSGTIGKHHLHFRTNRGIWYSIIPHMMVTKDLAIRVE